jgi:hypothetical protein
VSRNVPLAAYVVVMLAVFSAFVGAVLLRPDAATWAAAGTSAVLFTKVLYDRLEDDYDVEEMFE